MLTTKIGVAFPNFSMADGYGFVSADQMLFQVKILLDIKPF